MAHLSWALWMVLFTWLARVQAVVMAPHQMRCHSVAECPQERPLCVRGTCRPLRNTEHVASNFAVLLLVRAVALSAGPCCTDGARLM
jgi:hypothetical protein